MLVELDIQNFAIIKSLKITFPDKMTVLIGETGAGKSILIDALSLILGKRAHNEMIRTGESKASVTGLFTFGAQKAMIKSLCTDYGLPFDGDDLIVSREISNQGRNRIRINGQLTTITVLRVLGQYLVDIHGQNDQQMLMNQAHQIDLIDDYAGEAFKVQLADYQKDYRLWSQLRQQLARLQKNAQELAQRQDILQFQNRELITADLKDPQEDFKLENDYQRLKNYQKIADTANYLSQLFDDDEHGLSTLLDNAQIHADALTEYGADFKNMAQSLTDGIYSLNDFRSALETIMDNLDFDESHYQFAISRLDTLNTLKKKYGPTLADVFKFETQVQKSLTEYDTGGLDENKLVKQITQVEANLKHKADALHRQRIQTAMKLEKAVKGELSALYMQRARFSIHFSTEETFRDKGSDRIAFYIAPNPGEALMPLVKIVSGGEQSRLILALKAIFSQVEPVGTMIFDEIDSGVSGRVAAAIGQKMQAIGTRKQVIAITHSPQVAASSDFFKKISKQVKNEATYTKVTDLKNTEIVNAIAQMMAGEHLTPAAKQNASDLLTRCQRH